MATAEQVLSLWKSLNERERHAVFLAISRDGELPAAVRELAAEALTAPAIPVGQPGEALWAVWRNAGKKGEQFLGTLFATDADDAVSRYATWANTPAEGLSAHRGRK